MICVTLGRARHKRMIAEHQFLVEQGAELVELRLDYIGRAVSLKRLIDDRPGPVVITVRRRQDGGRWMKTEDERMTLLRSAIAAGVDYVDIEEDVADQIPRYGTTKRIISYHNFSHTPDDLWDLHARMVEKDADIVKIATMANSFDDNLRMMQLVRESKVPTIGICMGESGTITRIMADRLGSPFTYATFSKDKKIAPGLLDWKEMKTLYRYDEITDETKLFGVVADPVAHSHSPLIHNKAFEEQKINARYLPFRITKSDLPNFIRHCKEIGVQGLSVTIPHKEAALDYCSQAESSATGIGAVNTLIFDKNDVLGYNTDYRAAMDCIQELFNIDKTRERPMQGMTALVLGAGGVSRAIAWGLRQRHCEVLIASRTLERSQILAAELGCRAIEWDQRHDQRIQLLVNGSPVGMHPDVDNSPFNATALNQFVAVFDTVYNPENTLLIKNAKQAGCRIITGVDMFVRQAAYQYKLFTGNDAPIPLMRETIKKATNPVQLN
ncbi:Shikimate dehydrogenase [Rubripirellula lacrimiformis]|uniref:Multifunctional fusion protein n=1 Tax=Rubripirellula lacrimiformis TaxID=1930273 RepID=A0A517NKD2_9BACT|nr:shikimate dehydrogenase [Rubripirellula lacrimiformis]QDT07605.1 Shikimate dehydrogenase [Rubripirellula lacrimiformis]